jgi:hypothetical protein
VSSSAHVAAANERERRATRLVIICDRPLLRSAYRVVFESLGAAVVEATGLERRAALVEAEPATAILIDLVDGSATAGLEQRAATPDVHIVTVPATPDRRGRRAQPLSALVEQIMVGPRARGGVDQREQLV